MNLWKCVCLFLLICTAVPSQAQDLKSLLGTLTESVSSAISKSTVNESSIVGTWKYSSPSCKFESDNLLAKAGGTVASSKVEEELTSACNKLNITSDNTSFTFNSDGTYSQSIAGKKSSGTYTFDTDNMSVALTGSLGFSMTAYVSFSGSTMTLVYDADRVLELAKGIASVASKFMDSSLLTIFSSVSDNYEGMQLGFKLQK